MISRKVKIQLSLTLTALIVGIWLVFRLMAWGQCAWYGHQTTRDVKYAAFVGCMVHINDHWVPRSELRTEQ